ncbi:MAG: aspartate kinase [Bacteroidota bacterium]|nr:aspartate kinase [Bacteroidota bacterium]
MQIYKFGGASVKNAESVKNLSKILSTNEAPVIVVISAMGKTTNAFEKLVEAYFTKATGKVYEIATQIKTVHLRIFNALIKKNTAEQRQTLEALFNQLDAKLKKAPSLNYDYEYDQIVPFGELLSTKIVYLYLQEIGIPCDWLDVRQVLRTDNQYRAANIDWKISAGQFQKKLANIKQHVITQGFLGSTREGISTTLGREGSDYTASVLANLSQADEVIIWKDVPGIMNADPKQFPSAHKLEKISYQEAVELAFYGAKIIHPKTIQPLQNKQIPLKIKSFLDPLSEGSVIREIQEDIDFRPVYILKEEQVLISISLRDFSFVNERQISEIYGLFDKHRAHVSLIQNSAISYSACVDCEKRRLSELIEDLGKRYKVLYNEGVVLITIRHYTESCIDELLIGKEVLLEQRSRRTARFVVRNAK